MSIRPGTQGELRTPQRAGDCVLPLSEAVCSDLVARHGPMVKAACHRILRDASLAEDAAQEVFVLLVRKLPSLPHLTILGGWLYVTACQLARTHQRAQARRWQRENQPEAIEYVMKPAPDTLWQELEPLLDDAMLTLSPRQRELVLFRYFQENSQRAAAALVGCSESVASRELAAAIENLRRFFSRHGVTVSGAALIGLLTDFGAQASLGAASVASTLSAASALAGTTTAGGSLLLALMKTTTTTKSIAVIAALLLTWGTVHQLSREDVQTVLPTAEDSPAPTIERTDAPRSPRDVVETSPARSPRLLRSSPLPVDAKAAPADDGTTLMAAREKVGKLLERLRQLALMTDPLKIKDFLASEYGIHLSVEEIARLQERGPKGFLFGVVELWGAKQPHDALSWAASAMAELPGGGWDLHQQVLEAARKALPDLNRETLEQMLPEGPGKAKMLDLAEATTDPASLADRILNVADPVERASRLRLLAKGWSDTERSVEWARQNLAGTEKTQFYAQVGYDLAHQNPEAAMQVLAELQSTEAYASTFIAMMRGLVQEGGRGQQASELIANSNFDASQRAEVISELARRWVRSSPDAAIEWVNTLADPDDFRAAIPLLVSQLDRERVSRTVDAYLQHPDPVMERALIEAAAPSSLMFDPETSRLILDPLINRDPGFKLTSGEENHSSGLWQAVNLTAKRQAEAGPPAAAMEWLGTLPFASESDYAQAMANVMNVWNLRSPTEAAEWLQNAGFDPTLKADVLKATPP